MGHFLGNLTVPGRRGISHGDVIDLMREDIAGFDVREFYIETGARAERAWAVTLLSGGAE